MSFAQPRSLEEAVSLLSGGAATLLAGGTDLYPAHVGRPLPRHVVSLGRVTELRGISRHGAGFRLGGGTTWSEIAAANLPPAFDALRQAARDVGSIQIQNRGTIAGNLCNASPAADGVPPLLALDAAVELASANGTRQLPLSEFITGYRRTARQPDEILSAVIVPPSAGRSAFVKLGARRYLVISIVMAGACVEMAPDGSIASVRVAIGAASPVAQRLPQLERELAGLAAGIRPSSRVATRHVESLRPIDDVRAEAWYRRDAAIHVLGAALDRAAGFESS
ncbi:MAG: FAD binding domain-containing protein [Aestuariivirga sp.]|jgi:CO/xanthine dehydrogenase FAD-binding subunit